jgi:hypothetical protein
VRASAPQPCQTSKTPFQRIAGNARRFLQGLKSLNTQSSLAAEHSNLIGGEAIGSLPAGLTIEEKKNILRATPMSPALSLLNSLGVVCPIPSRCIVPDDFVIQGNCQAWHALLHTAVRHVLPQ